MDDYSVGDVSMVVYVGVRVAVLVSLPICVGVIVPANVRVHRAKNTRAM